MIEIFPLNQTLYKVHCCIKVNLFAIILKRSTHLRSVKNPQPRPGSDEEAIKYVLFSSREQDVKFIRLWFTDILGTLKGFAITVDELEDVLRNGASFDGASIEGLTRADEADMIAMPDPSTFQVLPWRPSKNAVARMFCDIETPAGEPSAADGRQVLRRNILRASERGLIRFQR